METAFDDNNHLILSFSFSQLKCEPWVSGKGIDLAEGNQCHILSCESWLSKWAGHVAISGFGHLHYDGLASLHASQWFSNNYLAWRYFNIIERDGWWSWRQICFHLLFRTVSSDKCIILYSRCWYAMNIMHALFSSYYLTFDKVLKFRAQAIRQICQKLRK